MSYWFLTFKPFKSYWRLILCEYQLWWSIKPCSDHPAASSPKCWKNDENLKFSWKFSRNAFKAGDRDWGGLREGNLLMIFEIRWSALRVSGGNLVDGLPPARHFNPEGCSEKSSRLQWFRKIGFFDYFSKILKNIENNHEFVEEGGPAPRVIRAGTRLTVYPALPYSQWRVTRRSMEYRQVRLEEWCGRRIKTSSESTEFVFEMDTFGEKIIYKTFIIWKLGEERARQEQGPDTRLYARGEHSFLDVRVLDSSRWLVE